MKITYFILLLFLAFPCFAQDFDNPYMDFYYSIDIPSAEFDDPYMMYYNTVSKLQRKYIDAKNREQSTANKLLGAVAIGMTGIGGMQLASALAAQSADENAERDMKAYLATFRCDYGMGRNIVGGETNITLPNSDELTSMVAQYKQLAADLKSRKEALGMQLGIESETVLNAADMGLYNNASIGKSAGAFTSLSRALMDENSADATAWAEQKSDTVNKVKTGAIVGGTGAAGGAIGNILINHMPDKKNETKDAITKQQ